MNRYADNSLVRSVSVRGIWNVLKKPTAVPMGARDIRSDPDTPLPHLTQPRKRGLMTTIQSPLGARAAAPASPTPISPTTPAEPTVYPAIRTDQVAELQVS